MQRWEPALSPDDAAPPTRRVGRGLGGPRRYRRRLYVLVAAGMLVALAAGAAGTGPARTAAPRGESARLVGDARGVHLGPFMPGPSVYLGIDPHFATGPVVVNADEVAADIHRMFGIVSFYSSWSQPPLTKQFALAAAQGSLPMVSMKCDYPDAEVAAGDYDALISGQAKAYKAYGGPILLRWFWEMNWLNDNTVCLGTGTNQATEYIAAYIHIWKIFQRVGATNVRFVWAPSAAKSAPSPAAFYPGARYVNWIGADLYDRPGYTTFAQMFAGFYATWRLQHKPMILSETGAIGVADQVAWLTSIAYSFPTEFPQMRAFVYVDAPSDPLGDYFIQPGGAAMAELRALGHDAYFGLMRGNHGAGITTP
jgi:Glycosyl hydrolase family 26